MIDRRWLTNSRARVVLLWLVMLAGGLAASSAAQTPPVTPPATAPASGQVNYAYRYRLLGVYDEQTGEPIEGVEVADVLNGNKSLTTKTGTVSLLFLPEGSSVIRLRKLGFEVQTLTVSISPAEMNPITVTLPRATQLPTVTVTDSAPRYISPNLRGFEERRKVGIGRFIAEDVMRKGENQSLGDVIVAHMPGLMIVPGTIVRRPQSEFLVSTRKRCAGNAVDSCRSPNCFVTVYEDGAKIYDLSTSDRMTIPDVQNMSSRNYAGAEYYAGGEVPPEYNGTGSGCGVLLLWSRER
jgi:hypothetical protein